jgi:hypothetical protein
MQCYHTKCLFKNEIFFLSLFVAYCQFSTRHCRMGLVFGLSVCPLEISERINEDIRRKFDIWLCFG